jgi:hypothetical protein
VKVKDWCPFIDVAPQTDDQYFEALTAAVFQARFNPEVVRRRWIRRGGKRFPAPKPRFAIRYCRARTPLLRILRRSQAAAPTDPPTWGRSIVRFALRTKLDRLMTF